MTEVQWLTRLCNVKQLPGISLQVLRAVLDSLPVAPRVKQFVVDFERGVWQALRSVFTSTNVHIRGCCFHWAQAIWRKVQELGLQVILVLL